MRLPKLRLSGALLALPAVLCWCESARAAPFVHISGSGVTGQSSLDITNLVVKTGGTAVPLSGYSTISSNVSTTINSADPSRSQTFTGPGFTGTTATVTFDLPGGQTYAQASNTLTTMHAYSENLSSSVGTPTTGDGANVQTFFFTAATAGSYDIQYGLIGHTAVNGTFAPNAGTTATADYAFGVDITRQVGTGTPTTTSVALEKGGSSIPVFGTQFISSQDQAKAFGTQYTITGVQAGELIQLKFYETTNVSATVGAAASAVPEPSSWLLACLGFVGCAAKGLRRRNLALAT